MTVVLSANYWHLTSIDIIVCSQYYIIIVKCISDTSIQ